ncbi:MAG: 2-isopropylmalate synthase [Candidatus Nitrosotenuis sp.]|uniref:Putative 2-isopropylmalate synthase n=1 Tax=Candidatus Nitrosotenuis uzonensis TaxID=1407055 RepID=A0A812F7X9_9ARCH|nr:2-isopropylmalate synthase [Candidatus Nitrosotenuis uzonensis]CAE6497592.1 putative 2-isopropylmalate synthase [Candidatus Nitrosotenuis uzonensis]
MRIRIFDTTLRDGEQTPGVALSPEKKLLIAKKLDELGVDAIEAGFPVISEGERHGIKLITKANLSAEICGLARTNKKDIDAAIDCGLNYIHTFIATSDIHLQYKLKMSREQALEKAIEAVEYGKSHGLQVEFSAEDATRSDREFLKNVFSEVAKAGADRIDIPDTVGYSTPQYMAEITKDAIAASRLPISVHCHNDFGLAVANAIAGIQAGAQCAHVTINGIGERAGNASLEEFVMALQCLQFGQKWETGIKTKLLYETSKFVSNLAGITVQPNKAIVGENAFGHESGIHTHGILNNPLTYEPISPELVGRTRWLQVGKHAGIHGVSAMLEEYGVKPTEDQLREILEKVKAIGDQGKQVTDVELLSIANEILAEHTIKRIVQLSGFSVSTGIGTMPYAFVKLNVDGVDYIGTDYGVGPVDAALNAIQKITGEIAKVRVKEYKLDSISGGSDALCEVTIKVEDAYGNMASAKSIGEDIVTTSVQAVIEGINRIMLKKTLKQKKIGS